MAKKDKKEVKEEVVEKITFTDKLISRRGKTITVRTYSDGKVEEL